MRTKGKRGVGRPRVEAADNVSIVYLRLTARQMREVKRTQRIGKFKNPTDALRNIIDVRIRELEAPIDLGKCQNRGFKPEVIALALKGWAEDPEGLLKLHAEVDAAQPKIKPWKKPPTPKRGK